MRGTRTSLTTAAFRLSPPERSASITSPNGIERAPTARLSSTANAEHAEGEDEPAAARGQAPAELRGAHRRGDAHRWRFPGADMP